jgi:inosine/xanthosine triphosphate pyrophosphatase family protein
MYLVSSNDKKLAEFRRLGLDIQIKKGLDLKEVQGTPDQVILYKALDAGKDMVVEDTILVIDGEEVVDIRWKLDQIKTAKDAQWVVSLGYNDGEYIHVYRGVIEGRLLSRRMVGILRFLRILPNGDNFGFDPFFVPDGTFRTLDSLNKIGMKDQYSARRLAVCSLLDSHPIFSQKIIDIPDWTGKYQH